MSRQLLLLCIFMVLAASARAQFVPEPVGPDSVKYAYFPAIGYSSDAGLMLGGIFSRYDYSGDTRPFNSYIQSSAIASTKGFVKVDALYEKTDIFGTDLRSTNELYVYRIASDNFFGVGNSTGYTEELWEQGYYFFESISFGLDLKLRKPLYVKGRSRFDLVGGVGGEYYISYELQSFSSFSDIMPYGSEGGFIPYLAGGFVWENRDREFDPRSGNRGEFNLKYAPNLISEYALAAFSLDFRQYFYVLDFLTVAGRFQGKHTAGKVPFWKLPALGDDYTLRGYPLYRFRGNSSIAYNLELRSWMFTFPEYQVKLGVHLFTDGGRVFTGEDDMGDLLSGYKQTYGIGGAFSLFSPDFILRGEMGFSDEVSRIYIGIGYTF